MYACILVYPSTDIGILQWIHVSFNGYRDPSMDTGILQRIQDFIPLLCSDFCHGDFISNFSHYFSSIPDKKPLKGRRISSGLQFKERRVLSWHSRDGSRPWGSWAHCLGKQREARKWHRAIQPQCPHTSDSLPAIRLHPLKVPSPSEIALPAGDQVFRHLR